MNRYFVRLAFNGSNFHGWQIQSNAISVQQQLNRAFSLILNLDIQLTGCGRTDTGVHAKDFFAHFEISDYYNQSNLLDLIFRLNRILPDAISIKEILPVKTDAHARFSALSRTYEYHINRVKDPFLNGFSYYIYGDLDVDLMNKGAKVLMSFSDFSSFSKSGTQVKTNLCNVIHAHWEQRGNNLVFTIAANRFLRNMVRAIVGTLLDLGKGAISLDLLYDIIEKRSRSAAGFSVPACGLFLTHVEYAQTIFLPINSKEKDLGFI
jgi:tRNA pseudouridine38-40 synthase